jgi:hypothetical protein
MITDAISVSDVAPITPEYDGVGAYSLEITMTTDVGPAHTAIKNRF